MSYDFTILLSKLNSRYSLSTWYSLLATPLWTAAHPGGGNVGCRIQYWSSEGNGKKRLNTPRLLKHSKTASLSYTNPREGYPFPYYLIGGLPIRWPESSQDIQLVGRAERIHGSMNQLCRILSGRLVKRIVSLVILNSLPLALN